MHRAVRSSWLSIRCVKSLSVVCTDMSWKISGSKNVNKCVRTLTCVSCWGSVMNLAFWLKCIYPQPAEFSEDSRCSYLFCCCKNKTEKCFTALISKHLPAHQNTELLIRTPGLSRPPVGLLLMDRWSPLWPLPSQTGTPLRDHGTLGPTPPGRSDVQSLLK